VSLSHAKIGNKGYEQNAERRQDPSIGSGQNIREQQGGCLKSKEQAQTRRHDRAKQNKRTTGNGHGLPQIGPPQRAPKNNSRASIALAALRARHACAACVDARRGGCYKQHFKAAARSPPYAPRGGARCGCQPACPARIRVRGDGKFRRNNSMPSIGHQLGELFLGAAPTVLIILIFYLILRPLFFRPLLKVMAEREVRTVGAQKAAEAAQAAAAEKVKQYQEALKKARGKVYAEQEAARKKLLDERAAQLKDARSKAAAELGAAKQRVAKELAAAQRDVESSAAQLAAEIARRILQAPPPPSAPAREAR
jgi:F-type H+-transporting ATPase subunit b